MIESKILQLVKFNHQWYDKISKYKTDNLADIFDKFTTLFEIYNKIYNTVRVVLKETEELGNVVNLRYRNKKLQTIEDKSAATDCISHYLKLNGAQINELIKSEIDTFKTIIQDKRFYINTKNGEGQPEKDQELLDGLNSEDEQTQLLSILMILYFLRCNLVHGEKDYIQSQKEILLPAINCLTVLNKTLMEKLTQDM
jgi:hypothetical protein